MGERQSGNGPQARGYGVAHGMRGSHVPSGSLWTLVLAAVLVSCAPVRPGTTHPPSASVPATGDLILTFWCAPPLELLDDRRAAEIVAAGFNVIGPPCEGSREEALNLRVLDVAARHGLRVWVRDPRIELDTATGPHWRERLAAAVAAYSSHPALAGYFVDDEPTADEFERIAELRRELERLDPGRLAYVNLLPDFVRPAALGTDSYDEYVERYVEIVAPRLLSFDYYPFGKEKDRPTFFRNLETVRRLALKHQVPFLLILLAMPHGPYRDPTEAEIAWQAHHALAFGARGISYFAYWTPVNVNDFSVHKFRYGLLENGLPTLHYHQAARLNRELRALGREMAGLESLIVLDSAGEIAPSPPFGPLQAADGGALTLGFFLDRAGRPWLLLVNRDYRYGAEARLVLAPGAAVPEAFDADLGRWSPAHVSSLRLAPGAARLLRWR